jgi:hypothetical protein
VRQGKKMVFEGEQKRRGLHLCCGVFEALDHALRAVEPRSLHANELHGNQLQDVTASVPQPPQADGGDGVVEVQAADVPGQLPQHVAESIPLLIGGSMAVAEPLLAPVLGREGELSRALYGARLAEPL